MVRARVAKRGRQASDMRLADMRGEAWTAVGVPVEVEGAHARGCSGNPVGHTDLRSWPNCGHQGSVRSDTGCQLDRVLDPAYTAVQLDTLVKAASAVGRDLRISLRKLARA
jgi:hypothetical protein